MPWAFISIVLVFAVGVVVFHTLDPVAQELFSQTEAHADSEASQKGLASLQTIWEYWPVWFLGILFVFGYVEAVRKSQAGGVR